MGDARRRLPRTVRRQSDGAWLYREGAARRPFERPIRIPHRREAIRRRWPASSYDYDPSRHRSASERSARCPSLLTHRIFDATSNDELVDGLVGRLFEQRPEARRVEPRDARKLVQGEIENKIVVDV